MQRSVTASIVVAAGLLMLPAAAALAAGAGAEARPDTNSWTSEKLFSRLTVFSVPPHEVQLGPGGGAGAWDFTKADRGNFTAFNAVTNVQVTKDGALAFTLTGKTGLVDWGNYGGNQPEKDRVLLWPGFNLKLKVRQSLNKPTELTLQFWPRGADNKNLKTLSGTDWQELSFPASLALPRRDGFEFEIKGSAGNQIEFKDLQITRYENQGCFRKEIVLPAGAVWRAVAEVGAMTRLFINGREVPSPSDERPFGGYVTESVGLTEYFVPGQTNCVALFGQREGASKEHLPYICMQGSVIMSSGERIPLDTDTSWKWMRAAPEGWKLAGFNDSGWRQVMDKRKNQDDACLDPSWRYLFAKSRLAMPVHDGYIHLMNPLDNQLYYTDQADMVFHAFIPDGLAKQNPKLDWVISRYENRQLTEVKRGTAGFEKNQDRPLRSAVNGGRLARGAYALKTTLTAGDGAVLDDRIPEPFLVTGPLAMRETYGESYTQDLDLEREREIDLTNPKDGPWTEAEGGRRAEKPSLDPEAGVKEPSIVERGGLKYRETKPAYGAIISYLVEFKHPGDFYLLELDYPNDAERHMGVACCPGNWSMTQGYSKTAAAVCTGDRYPVTGKLQTLCWLYRPDPGNHSLNLVNFKASAPAAGAKLRISHIKNGLPALRAPAAHTRWNGLITERTRSDPDRFGIEPEPLPDDASKLGRLRSAMDGKQPVLENCAALARHLDACEAFAQYLRFTGQNIHMMGNFQYHPGNAPGFVPDWSFPCARNRGAIQDVLARVLRDNGVDFYAHIEYAFAPKLMALAASQPPRPKAGFWDTVYLVKADGDEYNTEWGGRYGFNFNHPEVRKTIMITADEMARKFRTLPNFKGLLWADFIGGDTLPTYRGRLHRGPLKADEFTYFGYGDVDLREFSKDTGCKDPFTLDDPERFQKRHDYLNSQAMRDKWLAWRAGKMAGFFHEVASTAGRQRPDLKCVCNLDRLPQSDTEWRESGLAFKDYMLANGWDGALFAKDSAICLANTMYGVMNKNPEAGSNRGWDMSGLPEQYAFFKSDALLRAAQIRHDWLEVESMSWKLPYRENWPRQFQLTLMEQPDGLNTREVFIRALIGADPSLFYYGFSDATLLEGNEQPLREFNRALRALPAEKFQPVDNTGLDTNLAIRELRKDKACWFYVANPGYWPVDGELALTDAGNMLDAVSGKPANVSGDKLKVALDPFGLAVFKTVSANAKITGWKAEARKGVETAWLEGVIAATGKLLETPAALVTLRPEDEKFMREAVASAREHFKKGELAAALLDTSSDRFWVMKTMFLDKGAEYVTDTERSPQFTTERRKAQAVFAAQAPALDGNPDDAVWKKAETYTGFICSDESPAMAATSFQVANDKDNLYLLVRCKDRKPAEIKMAAKGESDVFKDDCVAMFIRPDPAQPVYYQMASTAGGVKFDQQVRSGAKDNAFAPPWEVKTAVTKDGWIAEIKLPAAALDGRIEPGKPWGFNIHRAFRNGIIPPCSWSYSPGGWHEIDRLGELDFAPAGK